MLDLWKTLTLLQHHYPLPDKVTVTVDTFNEEKEGECCLEEDTGYLIRISKDIDEKHRDEILVHEYAHAVCHYYHGPNEDAVWGIAYAELYKLVFGDH